MSERGDRFLLCTGLKTQAEENLLDIARSANKSPDEMSAELKMAILSAAHRYHVACLDWLRAKGAIP